MKIINILFLLTLITEANAQSIEALKNARFSNERQRNPSLKEPNMEPIKNVTNERQRNLSLKESNLEPNINVTNERQRNPSLKESNIEPIKNVTNERKRNPAIKYEKDLAPIKKPTMEKQ